MFAAVLSGRRSSDLWYGLCFNSGENKKTEEHKVPMAIVVDYSEGNGSLGAVGSQRYTPQKG